MLQTCLELLRLKIRFRGSFITHLDSFYCFEKHDNCKDYCRCACKGMACIFAECRILSVNAIRKTHLYRLLPIHPAFAVIKRHIQISVFIKRRYDLAHRNVRCFFFCSITDSADLIAHFCTLKKGLAPLRLAYGVCTTFADANCGKCNTDTDGDYTDCAYGCFQAAHFCCNGIKDGIVRRHCK